MPEFWRRYWISTMGEGTPLAAKSAKELPDVAIIAKLLRLRLGNRIWRKELHTLFPRFQIIPH